ncbi:MAG: O-GlcNAc transferase [Candidatus Binatia bacterium]|nr:MAG: O-GlcNAc transferase [Candidatus Binatia bacterium]
MFLAVLTAYIPALNAGFVWDDDDYVTRNPTLRTWSGLARIWFDPRALPQYYPLVHTTFWLEYRLWGLHPFGYHLVNVLLHAANAVLVWRVLALLELPGAFLAGLLFGLHPVHVESVAWVTERKNTLSGFFFLLAAWAFFRGLRSGLARQGRWFWGAGGSFVAALLSKTVTATLPVSLAVVAWAKGWWSRALVWRLVPLCLVGATLAAVTVYLETAHVGARGPDWDLSFLQRVLIASRALWFYLGCLVYPVNLAFIYPRWEISANDLAAYVPLVSSVGVGVLLAVGSRWWSPWPLVAALYFAVSLGPALGFVNVFPMRYSFVADHFQYLASIGPLALAAGLAARGYAWFVEMGRDRAANIVMTVAGLSVLVLLGGLTWRQATVYQDLETLWRDTLRKNPRAWMAHNNLGLLLLERGDVVGAEQHFRQALEAKRDDSFAKNNLGLLEAQRGNFTAALDWFRQAVEEDPTNAEAPNNLGNTLAQLGRWPEAEAGYREALRRNSRSADAWNNLANVLALQGNTAEASRAYERAIQLDPDYATAYLNYARLLAQTGRVSDARSLLKRLRRRDPANPELAQLWRVLAADSGGQLPSR